MIDRFFTQIHTFFRVSNTGSRTTKGVSNTGSRTTGCLEHEVSNIGTGISNTGSRTTKGVSNKGCVSKTRSRTWGRGSRTEKGVSDKGVSRTPGLEQNMGSTVSNAGPRTMKGVSSKNEGCLKRVCLELQVSKVSRTRDLRPPPKALTGWGKKSLTPLKSPPKTQTLI